ncbi:Inner membrane protein alx [bacterium HR11]|nr:Inner membrane protein alx [bacterium HR11]
MHTSVLVWVAFGAFILLMLALDLGVFHRRAHVVGLREALVWSAVWIALALTFNVGVYVWRGPQAALEFLTGYLIEKSLSVDNIFVFLLLFQYFQVPAQYQHRVLFWGILGALVMRAAFILGGIALIHRFHWVVYIFGAVLIVSGVRMAFQKDKEVHPERNPVLRLLRRFLPVSATYVEGRFFVKQAGRWVATPLLVVLVVVETTDLVFAVDSIPAIFAITLDPFIVYSSNVFAILGLRALYFALAGVMPLFRYLHYGLSAILVFVGVKMLISNVVKIPVVLSLGVVAAVLTVSVVFSLLRPAPAAASADPSARPEGEG